MSDVFFQAPAAPPPDRHLDVGSGRTGTFLKIPTGDRDIPVPLRIVRTGTMGIPGIAAGCRFPSRHAVAGDVLQGGAEEEAGAGFSDRLGAGVHFLQGALRKGDVDPAGPSGQLREVHGNNGPTASAVVGIFPVRVDGPRGA